MKKIMVLGCCGAGKSTFARALQQRTGLELIHLDQHYFQPNWVEPESTQWAEKVKQLAAKDSWIIDGNYGGTMDIRLAVADTVVFLSYPTWTCLKRVLLRTWKNYGKERGDVPAGCKERFSLSFLHYVALFNRVKRPNILAKLKAVEKEKAIYILSNDQAVDNFLKKLVL